ncbi:MAG TPA: ornithine cyclodeaminase family protein [Chryseosolibacter sp.]
MSYTLETTMWRLGELTEALMGNTLILSQVDVHSLLTIEECMTAVENAFRTLAEGKTQPPKVLGLHVQEGGLHIKAGVMQLNRYYIVAKLNSNFPANPARHHLPTIQGVVTVFDADNGELLALMDSIAITIIRTGAATGVAAKHLARTNAESITICGCGNQGLISLQAILSVRKLIRVFLYDTNARQMQALSDEVSSLYPQLEIIQADTLRSAVKKSDIVVTCTPSTLPLIDLEDVSPGTFIAAVGADSEHKNEIHPRLVAASKVVTDLTVQSAAIGDLHHAIKKGFVALSHVHAELGEVVAGKKPGRTNDEEVIIFDSTGTALQDVAAASIVYERALAKKFGTSFNLVSQA